MRAIAEEKTKALTFQELLFRLEGSGRSVDACCSSRTTWRWARGR